MYILPYGTRVYNKNGEEFIVFNKDNKLSKKLRTFIKSTKSKFIFPFSNTNPDLAGEFRAISMDYNMPKIKDIIGRFPTENITEEYENIKQEVINILSQSMYSS